MANQGERLPVSSVRERKRITLSTWNINGISDRILGDKFGISDFVQCVSKIDILVLTETWTHKMVHTSDFKCFCSTRSNSYKSSNIPTSGRISGGVMVFVKNHLASKVNLKKSTNNFVWCEIDKEIMGTETHVYLCGVYIPPVNSKYFLPELFEELENDIAEFQLKGPVILLGDFNSRTGKYEDHISIDSDNFLHNISENSFIPKQRNNYDNILNSHGKNLLQVCKNLDLRIINGRVRGDTMGNITYHGRTGVSTVDYIICDQSLFQHVDYFLVKSPCYLSDHSQLVMGLKISTFSQNNSSEPALVEPLTSLPTQFAWDEDSPVLFKNELLSPEVQLLINNFLSRDFKNSGSDVDLAVAEVNRILFAAATKSLKRSKVKRRKRIFNVVNKKWFDKECRLQRHAVRKIANLKRRDPMNADIRKSYHETLTAYKMLLKTKQENYRNEKLNELVKCQNDSVSFWNVFKTLPESIVSETSAPIREAEWRQHFGNLHSSPNAEKQTQQELLEELKVTETFKSTLNTLDFPITDDEIKSVSKTLKNKKAPSSDLIKNEMLKASYEIMLPVYQKLFNFILNTAVFPSSWCEGLITPIFKSGDKKDPGNYRGICVSSCLGKFFSAIINKRVLDHISSKNLLHTSQIGFMKDNRTADHIFTLRTLIEKYCHQHNLKIYSCFVDFKKAYDSVWHEGLFIRLLKYGIGGNIYDLIKSLYSRSACAVKIGNSKTVPFRYQRGVRQGCVISPVLFNLFINELPLSFEPNKCDPITLPNGEKLNCLLYADDLVILSKSKQGLTNCLKTLEIFNAKWLMDVNFKKTKVVIFQKSGRKPKDISFSINNCPIEIVGEYTYLGVKFTSSGSFDLCQKVLAEKALNTFYKIHKQLNFSSLLLKSAQKIFDAAIKPILTYGCEVWGMFIKMDFEKWDKTATEKAHLRFCKMFLGLNRKASNHAVRAEMGRFPLQITIIKHILNYVIYLNSKDDSSIVKQMFLISQGLELNCPNSYCGRLRNLFNFLNARPSRDPRYFTKELVSNLILKLKIKYENFWLKKIEGSTKLDFYRKFKQKFEAEDYLNVLQCCNLKSSYAKFRISNHSFAVETQRYCTPIIPRNKRVCIFCNKNEVEDEFHILFDCEIYTRYRHTLFQKLDSIFHNLNVHDKDEFTRKIFCTTDSKAIFYISNYIFKCLLKRKSLPPQ